MTWIIIGYTASKSILNGGNKELEHCCNFYDWLEPRNPFKQEGKHLYLLTTGIVSKYGVDKVNCDQAEQLGELIQKRLHGMNFAEVKFSKKDQFKSLSSYTRSVDVTSSGSISLNPTILFTRLATFAQRDEDVQRYYKRRADRPSVLPFLKTKSCENQTTLLFET